MIANGKFTMKHPIDHLVIICRHSNQSAYIKLTEVVRKVTFYQLGPRISEEELASVCTLDKAKSTCVLFDDVEYEKNVTGLSQLLVSAAVRLSHHWNIITIITLHSIFHNHEFYRLLQKNSQYYIFTKQVRERGSMHNLSRQIFGGKKENGDLLSDAFKAFCTKKSQNLERFNGLILDLNPRTPSNFRIRESFDIRDDIICYQSSDDKQRTVQVKYPIKSRPGTDIKVNKV